MFTWTAIPAAQMMTADDVATKAFAVTELS